ncbi:hypothetical protein [Streptomyces sp. NRRL F-5755]|uniref:hypothetical protein n=1 Tax=Streptomyces sp. NRRL F-5755 TaxID=1519475 RepID=UPI0013315539|nr:hypothetical protein [Streptomyces sp. NRRL F-5755]
MTTSVPDGMPDSDETKRMIWVDGAAYTDMSDFEGKKRGKPDLEAAEEAGDSEMTKAVTAGLDDAEQEPAQQLAMFLGSPNVQHLGSGQANGVRAEHYKGLPTVEEGLKDAKTVDALKPEGREKLLANVKKNGIKGYDLRRGISRSPWPTAPCRVRWSRTAADRASARSGPVATPAPRRQSVSRRVAAPSCAVGVRALGGQDNGKGRCGGARERSSRWQSWRSRLSRCCRRGWPGRPAVGWQGRVRVTVARPMSGSRGRGRS